MKSHKANINKTVSDYIAAREAKAEAEEALKKAESAMRLAMAADSVDSVIVDGVKVSLVEGRRPSYDVDKLQQMIKPNLFKTLVKMVVDGEKFKAAVKLGSLASDVAEACTRTLSTRRCVSRHRQNQKQRRLPSPTLRRR